MKKNLAVLLVIGLCGCDRSFERSATQKHDEQMWTNAVFNPVIIVTNDGHRFAVATYSHGIAICEVTDASLISEKEAK